MRLLQALRGEPLDRPPVWFMRQAGRYLPEYRELRSRFTFEEAVATPKVAAEITLQPLRRFPLDAAIVFSDILVVPEALGLGVTFGAGEGPQLARTLSTPADLAAWKVEGAAARMGFVANAVKHLKAALANRYGLFGFAGAPFTLFA